MISKTGRRRVVLKTARQGHNEPGQRDLKGDHMPALITHHLFGEESIDRLPAGVIGTDEERLAFLLANQGPDPYFFRVRTPRAAQCMDLARSLHRCRISRQFEVLRDGVSHLRQHDAHVGRAFVLGLLSHYALDRAAHPFVYAQQWGVQETDESLQECRKPGPRDYRERYRRTDAAAQAQRSDYRGLPAGGRARHDRTPSTRSRARS